MILVKTVIDLTFIVMAGLMGVMIMFAAITFPSDKLGDWFEDHTGLLLLILFSTFWSIAGWLYGLLAGWL